ncbi:MAG: hypothetical protein EHM57_05820 [Actinobacteria bacterium]|nr:MAG: hypothetical protein EHM57_05820 [Actinomycetota bacterium]
MHRFDPISFAFGLAFVAVAAIALFDLPSGLWRWVLPLGFLTVGVGMAAAAISSARRVGAEE